MRKFSSYGPVDKESNYYVPRKELISQAYQQLIGENPLKGGHYFTVWAPRQAGKTWILQEVLFQLQKENQYHILKLNLQILQRDTKEEEIIRYVTKEICKKLKIEGFEAANWKEFQELFSSKYLNRPLILILDEFDCLIEKAINGFAGMFRNIYISRQQKLHLPLDKRHYQLHGVALIGIRSVLGIENKKGSPFNVQRGMKIPNLTYEEVDEMFKWYEKESGRKVEQIVIDRLFDECRGQPGLTCWFGELLTQEYLSELGPNQPIDYAHWMKIYSRASHILPNNNIMNIVSKANEPESLPYVLELFRTSEKVEFTFEEPRINYLYLNGVIDYETEQKDYQEQYYAKFANPFIQKRLFSRYSRQLFPVNDNLIEPFESLDDAITETDLYIRPILSRYQKYLQKNSHWLFKNAPRRTDLKLFESIYHFNVYSYLSHLLNSLGVTVYPEFPTGNGKIDILMRYQDKKYGIELKSYKNQAEYKKAIQQAARYGKQLGLSEISLLFFVERIDDSNREKFEIDTRDEETGIKVEIIFIQTEFNEQ